MTPTLQWFDGCPPKPFCDEWFIAMLSDGDKVVLRALPEEWTYDFKTADETYYKAFLVKKWMQFPDSNFIPFNSKTATPEEVAEAKHCNIEGNGGHSGKPQ